MKIFKDCPKSRHTCWLQIFEISESPRLIIEVISPVISPIYHSVEVTFLEPRYRMYSKVITRWFRRNQF